MISVLILTLNEENILRDCLASVAWSDDVVVLDSFSSDRTVAIAKATGARVIQREFDNERDHRTFAIRQIEFKYPWVYNPDADEITTPELAGEMQSVVQNASLREVAFRVRFKTMFLGKWLKHSGLYPTWVVRLFKPDFLRFERSINLRYVIDGPEGFLNHHFLHYSFNKGFESWIEKHNRYSTLEATEALKSREQSPIRWGSLVSFRSPVERRRALKELSFRLPFRSGLRFLYMYVFRLGFLDGWPGLTYCRLLAWYEYMIVLKEHEAARKSSDSESYRERSPLS